MAIFSLTMKTHARPAIDSVVEFVASVVGTKLYDKHLERDFDYSDDGDVIRSQLIYPEHVIDLMESFKHPREQLWNLVHDSERRKNSRLIREIIVNVPYELSSDNQWRLVVWFAKTLANNYSLAVDLVLRRPPAYADARAFRAHLLLTTRCVLLDERKKLALGNKSLLEWSNKNLLAVGAPTTMEQLKMIRDDWATFANHFLKAQGLDVQIDARSHRERGLDFLPLVKLSAVDRVLENRGIATILGDYNRRVKQVNQHMIEKVLGDEQRVSEKIAASESLVASLCESIEATECYVKRVKKFTARSDKTDEFIEKYYQQTARTDRKIDGYL